MCVVADNECCVKSEHLQFCLFLISVSFNCSISIFSCQPLDLPGFPFPRLGLELPLKDVCAGEGC